MKIKLLQNGDVPQGALDHTFRCRVPVFLKDIFFQGACVYPYANRYAVVLAGIDNGLNLPSLSDVSRVYSEGINPSFDRLHGKFVIEVDICNQRNANLRLYLVNGLSILFIQYRHPDQLTPSLFQGLNLGHSGIDVMGLCVGHGLDGAKRIPADLDVAYGDLSCLSSVNHNKRFEPGREDEKRYMS